MNLRHIKVLTALVFAYDLIKGCSISPSTTVKHQNVSRHNDRCFPYLPISVISLSSFLILKDDNATSISWGTDDKDDKRGPS